ncbi:MAG TPA: dihydrofolate reductase family protein [Candidatus Dormibacteraeota bacterium]|nr:dihydrofolate reductase family protein [Candidatus Dormibacteraeota bacterium]
MAPTALFEVLTDAEQAEPRCTLEEEYGAALLLATDRVAVNFVSTIDGIVSYGLGSADSSAVGGGLAADRLLMAMLRAVAAVIVVGAGTVRVAGTHQWTPATLAPDRAGDLAALRAAAGLPASPAPLLAVSTSPDFNPAVDAARRPQTPFHVLAPPPPQRRLAAATIVSAARDLGGDGPILCEGGPHLFGTLVAEPTPLDLFLTVAPQLAGRSNKRPSQRRGLVEGVALPPWARGGRLRSVRRAGQHLLLRYAVDAGQSQP